VTLRACGGRTAGDCNIVYHHGTTHVFMPQVNMGVVKQENQTMRFSFFWVVNTAYVGGWLQTFRDNLFVPSSTAKSTTLEEERPENIFRNVGNKLQANAA
jgi:hypothetical protein